MTRFTLVAAILSAFGLVLWVAPSAGAQSVQDVCPFIQNQLRVSGGLKETLCQDFQAGIARGHIQPERALTFLGEVNKRITSETQDEAERVLVTIGMTIHPAKGDLPAELLIRRVFELFGRVGSPSEAMEAAAREVEILHRALVSVAQVYRGLGIDLAPNVSQKTLQTEIGEVELTVGRVDTVITATAIALDRYERRLDRSLKDLEAMQSEVMKELKAPSFPGAAQLPQTLIRYIDAHADGSTWAPIVEQMAQARGRES